MATTVQYLKENFDTIRNKSSQNTNLLGMGFSVSMKMPGSSTNERVQLVEFNTRALVHSTQQGQGYLFNKSNDFAGQKYYFNNSIFDQGDGGFQPRPQLNINDEYTKLFSYKLEDHTFAFNVTNSLYRPQAPKSFPDMFSLPDDFDPVNVKFNEEPDVFKRASLIGFGETGKTTYPGAPPFLTH